MEGKSRLVHLYIQEHLIFYINNIYINGIKKKEYSNVSQQIKTYTCYSINKQFIEGVPKWQKAYFIKGSQRVTWLYCSLTGSETCLSCSKNRVKKNMRIGFLDCHVTPHLTTNGLTHFLREIIVYYLPP